MSDNFVITIARGYGSGGRTIGKLLSEKLNIPFYDRELIYMASEESGINLELFGKLDEKVRKGFFDPPTRQYTGELIPPESNDFVSDENLFNYQAKIIKELADKEPCIIVGRCADFILRDRDNVIDAFIWAPMTECVKNVMALEPLSEREAEKKIKKINKHRSEYYRYYTCREWNDYRNYELCLDSSKLGFEKSAEFIKAYVGIKFGSIPNG